MTKNINNFYEKFKCSKCGCVGLHACTGTPIIWTQEDKDRLNKVMLQIFSKEKK